jgi:hypothetical protein
MLPHHLCRRDVPGLGEAILATDYAALEGLGEDEVPAGIHGRRILGTLFGDEWYVEAPPFCEERLAVLRNKSRYSNTREQHASPETEPQPRSRKPSPMQISAEEMAHAGVLGLRGKITFSEIKRSYRERMQEYHPDKVSSLGPKLRDVAEAEAKKINAAYEFFTRKYGPSV